MEMALPPVDLAPVDLPPVDLPPVDVVIPAFNAGGTIAAALRSVLAQSAPLLRVIVVDDGSTDATAATVEQMAGQDARVTLIRQENRGIAAAMNTGIAAGTAPFVARLDADDQSAPDRHERQLRYMMAHPDVVAVSGAHREVGPDGTPTGYVFKPPETPLCDPDHLPAREPELTQPFFMVRRAALDQLGGYRPYPVSEDTDLYWRLAEIGRLACLPDVLGDYRMHPHSISGASIAHGRRVAIYSQLAALAARRRRRGAGDIEPTPAEARAAPSPAPLADQIDMAARRHGLTDADLARLKPAVAAKLMELAGYRPFELDSGDCRFIAAALSALPDGLTLRNHMDLRKRRAATAARLLRLGRLRDALVLGWGLWPEVLARAASNRLYWHKRLP